MRTRPAQLRDVAAIHEQVRELAERLGHPERVASTPADLAAVLFPQAGEPRVFCQVAEVDGEAGPEVVAHALWYITFSTWTGGYGIWLEELVVAEAHRCKGVGRTLTRDLARICAERGYHRLEWSIEGSDLDSESFRSKLDSFPMTELIVHRLQGAGLEAAAR